MRLMALLDEIVQIFALTNFDGLTGFFLERLESRRVSAALIDRHLARNTMPPNGFPAWSGLLVATSGEQAHSLPMPLPLTQQNRFLAFNDRNVLSNADILSKKQADADAEYVTFAA